jgi:hypothetical protein
MDFLDHTAGVLRYRHPVVNENPANDQYTIFGFHLPSHFTRQRPATCLDLPRCQRGGKRAL